MSNKIVRPPAYLALQLFAFEKRKTEKRTSFFLFRPTSMYVHCLNGDDIHETSEAVKSVFAPSNLYYTLPSYCQTWEGVGCGEETGHYGADSMNTTTW